MSDYKKDEAVEATPQEIMMKAQAARVAAIVAEAKKMEAENGAKSAGKSTSKSK